MQAAAAGFHPHVCSRAQFRLIIVTMFVPNGFFKLRCRQQDKKKAVAGPPLQYIAHATVSAARSALRIIHPSIPCFR
jgi:hypothetical protein